MLATMHKEDVKAAIRKRFGSVTAFEKAAGIPEKSVNDVLRGRKSARVMEAIEKALNDDTPGQSEYADRNAESDRLHRLNVEAR